MHESKLFRLKGTEGLNIQLKLDYISF